MARLGLAALSAVLALGALHHSLALRGERQELTAWLAAGGTAVDTRLERELLREPDADGLAVRAARAGLAREMALANQTDAASPEGRAALRESGRRLAEAARRAGAALAERPASWEAAMVLGAATYLSESQLRDPRLFTAHEHWEEPLRTALRLAPAKREPLRFLTAAYLEIWPALTQPKRDETRRLVAEMLRDPDDLDMLLAPWLEIAGDRRTALSALPPESRVWERVQKLLAARGDWEDFSTARRQWNRLLRAELRGDLTAADDRLAQGDGHAARALYISVVQRARPDLSYRDLLDAALTRCPPGPVGRTVAASLAPQLSWAVERCLLAECALTPASLKRLALLAGDAVPAQEATAVLLAGDLTGAVRLERRADTAWSDDWAPYMLVKARTLIARQQLPAAAAALDYVPNTWWERPAYWQTRLELARAAGDAAAVERAAGRLRAMNRHEWPAGGWTWRQDRARLEMLSSAPARGLELELAEVPSGGAVIDLWLDGALLGTFPVRSALGVRVNLMLRPGLHLLEVESLGGGAVVPGAVRLR